MEMRKDLPSDIGLPYGNISIDLLSSEGLLTPTLVSFFGEIVAHERRAEERGTLYRRWSSLYQARSMRLLMHASIDIARSDISETLIKDLSTTTIPFGSLLVHHGIAIEVRNRTVFTSPVDNESYGRTSDFYAPAAGKTIARVTEILVPENELLIAHQAHNSRNIELCTLAS
jgi:hypothetical protein